MAQTREQPSVVHPAGSLDRACETSVSGTNLHEGQTSPHQEPCTKLRAEPVSTGAIATSTFQSLSIKNAELTLARHCQAPLRAPFPGTPFRAPPPSTRQRSQWERDTLRSFPHLSLLCSWDCSPFMTTSRTVWQQRPIACRMDWAAFCRAHQLAEQDSPAK